MKFEFRIQCTVARRQSYLKTNRYTFSLKMLYMNKIACDYIQFNARGNSTRARSNIGESPIGYKYAHNQYGVLPF